MATANPGLPVNITSASGSGAGTHYTVPAGRYAIVYMNASLSTSGSGTASISAGVMSLGVNGTSVGPFQWTCMGSIEGGNTMRGGSSAFMMSAGQTMSISLGGGGAASFSASIIEYNAP